MRILSPYLFILCFSSLFADSASATNFQLVLQKTITVNNGYFTTDPIGNIYLVKDKNFIVKYNAKGDSLAVYNDISSGSVSMIDASNPLRTLVFYAGFSQIKILDNLLSQKNELDLTRIGLFNIPVIANSQDGNIWVYDPEGKLLKIDDQLQIKHEYFLRNMINFVVNPCHLIEQERTLYMTDSTQGILEFDRYGFYKTVYRFKTKEVEVMNDYIVYLNNDLLTSYNTKTLNELHIQLPEADDILNARLEKEQVYILRSNKLDIYKLEQN